MISIIIPNYNNLKLLKKCVKHIKRHTRIPYSVIIVDNASLVKDWAQKQTDIIYLPLEENKGFASAVNVGIQKALQLNPQTHIFLLNNDCFVEENGIDEIDRLARQNNAYGIISAKLYSIPKFPFFRKKIIQQIGVKLNPDGSVLFVGNKEKDSGQYDNYQDFDYLSFACALITNQVVKQIGLLDEIFSPAYYEDVDYCMRAKNAGFMCLCCHKAKAYHIEGATSSKKSRSKADSIAAVNWQKYKAKWGIK